MARFANSPPGKNPLFRNGGAQFSWYAVFLGCVFAGAVLPSVAITADAAAGQKVIGLVLVQEAPGHFETPDGALECPEGLQYNEMANWRALPEAVRRERTQLFGHRWNRGPNGENSTAVPWAITDPLPLREVQSTVALGFDLSASPNACPHERFKNALGPGLVDNQLYRALGCAKGWRASGAAAGYRLMEFPTYPANRILIEISGVDDPRNDRSVEVRILKGLDPLTREPNGEFQPNLSQRVDSRFPLIARTVGKIVDGVLTVDPIPYARFPMRWNVRTGTRDWYDLHLQLKLTEQGAEGLMGGFQDLENYWLMYRRGLSISVDNSAWSPPSMYAATVRLADGRRDPVTGRCSAISSALKIKAVRAFIVHPPAHFDAALYDLRGY